VDRGRLRCSSTRASVSECLGARRSQGWSCAGRRGVATRRVGFGGAGGGGVRDR